MQKESGNKLNMKNDSLKSSQNEDKTFSIEWDKQDPISLQEKAHNKQVIQVQGFGLQL